MANGEFGVLGMNVVSHAGVVSELDVADVIHLLQGTGVKTALDVIWNIPHVINIRVQSKNVSLPGLLGLQYKIPLAITMAGQKDDTDLLVGHL